MNETQKKNLDHGRNKKGRPKGARNYKTMVQDFASMQVPYQVKGKKQSLPVYEILVQLLFRQVENGTHGAIALLEKLGLALQPCLENEMTGVLVVPATLPMDEWDRVIEIMEADVVKPNTYEQLLEQAKND